MRAIVMTEFGGPEVLRLADAPDPEPRRGHHLVHVTRAGVNFADLHVRDNSYLADVPLPYIPGNEVVGTIGPGGRRIAGLIRGGGYAQKALVHTRVSWDVPDDITDDQAVALALQGNSAWHLLHTSLRIADGETVVVPAAAGGLGSLAVQLAAHAGAKVIALASTADKRDLAVKLGAYAAVDSTSEDLTERIVEAAGGPVHAAMEMTGGRTFDATLAAVAPRGRLAVFGYASGDIATVTTRALMERSITVAGFWLPHLYTDRSALPDSVEALFAAVRSGALKPLPGTTYPLQEAARAHQNLASRTQTGKISLDTTQPQ
ncbi:quinone oxidoreductase family protein [Streptomyces olivoreticuli]|uniref:quinone oxidoreductase family protein n=1 Tax=Streptomyces olivoreticuli TaxID=68246 RepID=UPI000E25DAC9|nr:zinc-binding dehydrogenase [Streptomyces olivoreticuli]